MDKFNRMRIIILWCAYFLSCAVMMSFDEVLEQGNAMLTEGDIEEAIVLFEQAIAMDGTQYKAHSNKGHALRAIGRLDESIECFQKALDLSIDPSYRQYFNLAVVLHEVQRLEEAIELYGKAISKNKSHVSSHYNLGLVYLDLGDLEASWKSLVHTLHLESGHVDARLSACNVMLAKGDRDMAVKCYEDVLKIDPSHVKGLVNLAGISQPNQAGALLRRALELEPENVVAKKGLMALGQERYGIDESSDDREYAKLLFDSYAFHFDSSLERLQYRVPQLVAEKLLTVCAAGAQHPCRVAVDLGAGTGLACPGIRAALTSGPHSTVTGVDVSTKMLAKARQQGCYTNLHTGEMTEFLSGLGEVSVDLLVAADVLVYVGSLGPLFHAAYRVLRRGEDGGGYFIFSVESSPSDEGKGFTLGPRGRYQHSMSYIRAVAEEVGLSVISADRIIPRTDGGVDIQGLLVVLAS